MRGGKKVVVGEHKREGEGCVCMRCVYAYMYVKVERKNNKHCDTYGRGRQKDM